MGLRGPDCSWGTAIYKSSNDSYEDQYWFSGTTEEALDFVCDILVSPSTDWHTK